MSSSHSSPSTPSESTSSSTATPTHPLPLSSATPSTHAAATSTMPTPLSIQAKIDQIVQKSKELEQKGKELEQERKELEQKIESTPDELKQEKARLDQRLHSLDQTLLEYAKQHTLAMQQQAQLAQPSAVDLTSLFQQFQVHITENLVKNVAKLFPKPTDSQTNKTPAHLASDVEDALNRQRISEHFVDVPAQPAVLTKQQQDEVIASGSEESMVAHLTEHLWPWIVTHDSFRYLINSETEPWLEVKAGNQKLDLKPDLWIGPSYIVKQRVVSSLGDATAAAESDAEPTSHQQNRMAAQAARDAAILRYPRSAFLSSSSSSPPHPSKSLPYVFGVPYSTGWYDSIYPLAAKCSLTTRAFGEEIQYLQHLSHRGTDKMSRGMVFGATQFYLLTCHDGAITRRIIGEWMQPGTGPLIRDFFSVESPWEAAVRLLCNKLHVKPTRHLGIGGTARVIEVKNNSNGEYSALKVVLSPNISSLKIEQEYLSQLATLTRSDQLLSSILPTYIGSLHEVWNSLEQPMAAAFLIQPVGEPIDSKEVVSKPEVFCQILLQLFTLHQHGICHGDPRIPNLLRHVPSVRRSSRIVTPALSSSSSSSSSLPSSSLSAKPSDTYFWVDFMQRDPMAIQHLSSSTLTATDDKSDRRFQIHQDVHRFVDSFSGRRHERGPILTQLLMEYDDALQPMATCVTVTATDFRPLADKLLAFIQRLCDDPRAAVAEA